MVVLIPAIGFILISGAESVQAFSRIEALESNDLDAAEHAKTLLQQSRVAHTREWVATARVLAGRGANQDLLAIQLLDRSLEEDIYDHAAWALLSYVQTRQNGGFSDTAEDAFNKSIIYCPFCETALLKWRLLFVIEHWDDVSEPTRLRVFEGADLLRWWHFEGEFLVTARDAAIKQNIPFDEYRARIETPVRPNEVGR